MILNIIPYIVVIFNIYTISRILKQYKKCRSGADLPIWTKKPAVRDLLTAGVAEMERFELSRRFTHPTPLAGEPLRPLGYFSMSSSYAVKKTGGERGIRTPGTLQYNGFQDRRDRPLCHLSNAFVLQKRCKGSLFL